MDFQLGKSYLLKSIEQLILDGAQYDSVTDTLSIGDFYLRGSMLQMFGNEIFFSGDNYAIYLRKGKCFLATADTEESAREFLSLVAMNNITSNTCNFTAGLF